MDFGFQALDSDGPRATGQEQEWCSVAAQAVAALHGAFLLQAPASAAQAKWGGASVGDATTVVTMRQVPPQAAFSRSWTGRPQAGPDKNTVRLESLAVTASRGGVHRRALRGLDEHAYPAACALAAFRADFESGLLVCALTFELSGRRRQDASARMAKMYRVPPEIGRASCRERV